MNTIQHLEETIKRLEFQLNTTRAERASQEKFIRDAQERTDAVFNDCRKFCMKILRDDILKGRFVEAELKALPLKDLMIVAEAAYYHKKKEQTELYEKILEKFNEKREQITTLSQQLSQAQIRLAQIAAGDGTLATLPDAETEDPSLRRVSAYVIADNSRTGDNIPAVDESSLNPHLQNALDDVVEPIVKAAEESRLKAPINFEDIRNKLDAVMLKILEVMGKQGVCEYPEIKVETMKGFSGGDIPAISTINSAIGRLKMLNIITEGQKINSGLRWFYIFELTPEVGVPLFIDEFGRSPVENEVKKLIREHDNIKHGYLIKESSVVLSTRFDYDSVCTSRKANTIKLPNGRRSIPDIICSNRSGTIDYYEVECGNHTHADFNDKCNKLIQITTDIRFVVPSVDVLEKKLIPQVQAWMKSVGIEQLRDIGINVWITTVKKLYDKTWVVTFDMSSFEPFRNE